MRLVYLCTVDPPPPDSDWPAVQNFLQDLPANLRPPIGDNKSPHMLYFADRIGSNWLPEFYDFAIVFLSERFLSDEKAMAGLGRAKVAFPNMVCIDLHDNMSTESKEKVKKYSKQLFSMSEGKEFLINTLPQIASAYDWNNEKLTKAIEEDGYDYLDKTIEQLERQKVKNFIVGCACSGIAFLLLVSLLIFSVYRFANLSQTYELLDIYQTIILCVEIVIISTLSVSLVRFLFLLGKSFMVESIRNADRAHAIGLGKLYLQLYKEKFKWEELKDVLKTWNIDGGSAFRDIDAKDIEPVSLDRIISMFGTQK